MCEVDTSMTGVRVYASMTGPGSLPSNPWQSRGLQTPKAEGSCGLTIFLRPDCLWVSNGIMRAPGMIRRKKRVADCAARSRNPPFVFDCSAGDGWPLHYYF